MIRLKHDSRDFVHANAFGQAVDIPTEINFDTPLPDNVQPLGDVKCVCYSVCDEAEDEFGVEFDISDLWNRVPHNQFGSDPRDVLALVVNQDKGGLLPIGGTTRRKDYKSFYRADLGQRDAFDNVRVSATIAQTSVIGAVYWCAEWLNLSEGSVMPEGKTMLNGHAFTIEGWKQINGESMFIVEWWGGKKYYMPRKVFNLAMSNYGTQTWILATEEINNKRDKTILEAIKDTLINVVALLKQLLIVKKVDNPLPPEPQQVYNEVKEELMKKYDWSTQEKARHSVRLICDEEGLSVKDKNDLCATVGGESGWRPEAIGKVNFDGTRDYGIVQINEKYWIGKDKLFPSTDYVLNNPEVCVRWMCKQWKAGNKNWWYAYKNGSYKKFL